MKKLLKKSLAIFLIAIQLFYLSITPAMATDFTAGSAKRNAPGPFAAAPIVQGKWDGSGTPDVLSFSRGAQISGHYYANFDAYQGGGFVIWTPEISSVAYTGAVAYIWYVNSANFLYYDYTNKRYRGQIGGIWFVVSSIQVTAGTPEILAWGWDTKNTLDGTNYAYISRNNVQTFAVPTQPTVSAPGATIYIGSNGTASPSNGIIEGFNNGLRVIGWRGVGVHGAPGLFWPAHAGHRRRRCEA